MQRKYCADDYRSNGNGGGQLAFAVMEKRLTYSIGGGQLQEAITMDNEVSKTLNCMHEAGRILSVFRSTEVAASRPSTSAESAKSSEPLLGITAP